MAITSVSVVLARILADQRNGALRANNQWQAYAAKLEKAIEDRPVSLSDLHPLIKERCAAVFRSRHYEEALTTAVKCVEVRLREAIGSDNARYGVELAIDAFGGKTPPLRVSDVDAEQEACHLLFRGFFGFIRNPLMHRFLESESADIYTFERLVFASCLLRIIDKAKS
jgi:uncharacterized protein (TIGR02391 family)